MVNNTKNTVLNILKNNKELNKTDLKVLKSISKKFPFFTPSKVLSLLLAKKYKTIDYSKILESTATNITDRIHLYYILNNDILKDVDKQKEIGEGETETDAYKMLDLRVTKTFSLADNSELKISLFGRNLLDEVARNHSSFVKDEVPLPGKNVGVKFNLTF